MKNPDEFSQIVEEAWQKALGLLNFTRGQNAEAGLIIDRADHKGVKYTYAYFSETTAPEDSAPDTRFNFRPALAMPGNHLILSSTDQLARDLIAAALAEDSLEERVTGVHSYLEVDIKEAAAAFEANSESLIQQNMLTKGNTRPARNAPDPTPVRNQSLRDHREQCSLAASWRSCTFLGAGR